MIGTKVKPWGAISGVTNNGGERYYFFDEKGVALIPGTVVEWHYDEEQKRVRT